MSSLARRITSLAAVLVAAVALLVAGMYAYDHGRRDVIAKGVMVGGVDVGGLHASAARARIQAALVAPLATPVTIRSGGLVWHLTSRRARLTVDTGALVRQALAASRGGSLFTRVSRELRGDRLHRSIAVQISYSHAAVRAIDAHVRAAIEKPAQNASVSASVDGLSVSPGRSGIAVDSDALGSAVEHALLRASSRVVTVPTVAVAPHVATTDLAAQYPAYIIVNRSSFTLRLYQGLALSRTYSIAVGMQGLETPAGLYHVQWKQVDPPWYVPNSAWAGPLAGKVIPPGPQDPLKARFMSFDGAAGIHGIDPSEYSSIGHYASHGCVRMRIPDVIDLYGRTPVGTPVYIV